MNFEIIDTLSTYRRLLDAPDAASRERIFCEELITPFEGLVRMFGGENLPTFAMWGMKPEQYAPPQAESMRALVDQLAGHNIWDRAPESLPGAWAAFEPYADRIPAGDIVFALCLADLSSNPLARGYSGFGAVPGYIMTVYGEANAFNLPRVEAATVHEFHHNIYARISPFNPMQTTVGEYMIMEGLAESFAAELYDESVTGHWVSEFDDTRLDESKRVMREGLDKQGFDVIRGYIFGSTIARQMNLPDPDLPDFAGYALGYRVVQAYLKRTGSSVVEATFMPAREIIEGSHYFDME